MEEKLTPRQNEIVSEALAQIAVTLAEQGRHDETPERIKTIRRALVNELEAVSSETKTPACSSDVPSIVG